MSILRVSKTLTEADVISYADAILDEYGIDYYDTNFDDGLVHIIKRLPYQVTSAESLKTILGVLRRDYTTTQQVEAPKPTKQITTNHNLALGPKIEVVNIEPKIEQVNSNSIRVNITTTNAINNNEKYCSIRFMAIFALTIALLIVLALYSVHVHND